MKEGIRPMDAAKMMDCSDRKAKGLCLKGKLRGEKNPVTGRWLIDKKSVEELLASCNTKK